MTQPILGMLAASGDSTHYRPDLRLAWDQYRTILRESSSTEWVALEPHIGYLYQYDFYSLLRYINVPNRLHYPVLRVNGYTNPHQYTSDNLLIAVPSINALDRIKQMYGSLQGRVL